MRSLFTAAEKFNTVSADEFYAHQWAAEQQRQSEAQQAMEDAYEQEAANADWEAEQRNERWFEERGYDEARAQEDHEARLGVVSFHDALREAERV